MNQRCEMRHGRELLMGQVWATRTSLCGEADSREMGAQDISSGCQSDHVVCVFVLQAIRYRAYPKPDSRASRRVSTRLAFLILSRNFQLPSLVHLAALQVSIRLEASWDDTADTVSSSHSWRIRLILHDPLTASADEVKLRTSWHSASSESRVRSTMTCPWLTLRRRYNPGSLIPAPLCLPTITSTNCTSTSGYRSSTISLRSNPNRSRDIPRRRSPSAHPTPGRTRMACLLYLSRVLRPGRIYEQGLSQR
jgi:hypothetical protein